MWINIDLANYLTTTSNGAGIQVLVHPAESYPRINERALSISPGTEAYLAINEHRITNLPKPYSDVDCIDDSGVYRPKYGQLDIYAKSYNREACQLDCMLEMSSLDCNCSFSREPYCHLSDFYSCFQDGVKSYFSKCNCPYPCKYTEYEATLSTLALPTPTYINRVTEWNLTHTTSDAIKENAILLKVYFPDLQITKITQYQAYTSFELISNLGGQLGLFLGASLITMGELIEFLLQMCYYRCKHFMKRQKSVVQPSEKNKQDFE